jgi:diguanylate cyclase
MSESADLDQKNELLRLALPLMTKHRVPVTPENYSLWYEYVLGANTGLCNRMDELIGGQAEFTETLTHELYERFVSRCNTEKMESIRGNLQSIIKDVSTSLSSADARAEHFSDNLGTLDTSLQGKQSLDEIQKLLDSLLSETAQMQNAIAALRQHILAKSEEVSVLQTELEQERVRSKMDPMTKLANRAAFFAAIRDAIDETEDAPGRLCMLLLDIDAFREINNTHGHLVGDRVIKFVAESIRRSVKGKDTAARYSGEKFAVLLPDTPFDGARLLGQNIMNIVANAKLMRADTKQPLNRITLSTGLAVYKRNESIMDFVNRTNQALVHAKKKGPNQLCTEQVLNN